MKKAFITGQGGSYLAEFLLSKGYEALTIGLQRTIDRYKSNFIRQVAITNGPFVSEQVPENGV